LRQGVDNRLRKYREARGLTLRELSLRLDVTESTIERWETVEDAHPPTNVSSSSRRCSA
jgi:transcriptional regulator with XRE-family HTH domain